MNGEQHRIDGHGYTAVVCGVGGALRVLQHEGRDLVVPYGADELRPLFRGVIAVPWPNRIGDGRYAFNGAEHQVPLNEPERATALHGLVLWDTWELVDRRAASLVLQHRLNARQGYPWTLDLEVTYEIGPDGLEVVLVARNAAAEPAPYGVTIHPYLTPGAGTADDWRLDVPADSYLEVTPERSLPVGLRDVEGTPFDLRAGDPLGARAIDHAYTHLRPAADGCITARLTDGDGRGTAMTWDATLPWVQVFTSDQPGTPAHRTGVAVEPMTCPPDAFRTGTDVVALAPGEAHTARWLLSAIG
jgi:aldose 1-epimerase